MDYDSFIDQAWAEHATDPAAVAARLQAQGLPQVTEAARIVPMAHLAHHVLGQHLGHWQDALQVQQQLAALPCCRAARPMVMCRQRCGASAAAWRWRRARTIAPRWPHRTASASP